MARAINCDARGCTLQIPDPNDDDYVTIVVTVGKGMTRSLRRDLCEDHVIELTGFLNAELVPNVPVPKQSARV